MFKSFFGSHEGKDKEEKLLTENRSFFERQKHEQDIRDRVAAELNQPELEKISVEIYHLHGNLSVADPLDLQYTTPDPKKAALIRMRIDELIELHGQLLAEYMKLKRKKSAEFGVLNPGYVDTEANLALFRKGLMEEWRWEDRTGN